MADAVSSYQARRSSGWRCTTDNLSKRDTTRRCHQRARIVFTRDRPSITAGEIKYQVDEVMAG